jgi:hypothetical protein
MRQSHRTGAHDRTASSHARGVKTCDHRCFTHQDTMTDVILETARGAGRTHSLFRLQLRPPTWSGLDRGDSELSSGQEDSEKPTDVVID